MNKKLQIFTVIALLAVLCLQAATIVTMNRTQRAVGDSLSRFTDRLDAFVVEQNRLAEQEAPSEKTSFDPICSEVPFYETLSLAEGEKVMILDATSERLLINRYFDYHEGDDLFREEGYGSYTSALEIFNVAEQAVVCSIRVAENAFCTDGAFLPDGGFAYVTVTPVKNELSDYTVEVYREGVSFTVDEGGCYETGFDAPEVVSLGGGCFAYSYHNSRTNEFGVNVVSARGDVTPQISLREGASAKHLRTTLRGYGAAYLYYAAVDGKGTVWVGDSAALTHRFSLPSTERVYDYCFLEDRILFTIEEQASNGAEHCILMKDLDGNNLLRHPCETLYRLETNGKDTVLGIDGSYAPHSIRVTSQGVEIQKLNLPKAPVRFYSTADNAFFLHYDKEAFGSDQGLQQLLRLTI